MKTSEKKKLAELKAKAKAKAESDDFKKSKRNKKTDKDLVGVMWKEGTKARTVFDIAASHKDGITLKTLIKECESKDLKAYIVKDMWKAIQDREFGKDNSGILTITSPQSKPESTSDNDTDDIVNEDTLEYKGFFIAQYSLPDSADEGTFHILDAAFAGKEFKTLNNAKGAITKYLKSIDIEDAFPKCKIHI